MRQLARILALVLVAGLVPGCFVLEEIDSGMELMKETSPKAKPSAEDPEPVATPSERTRPDLSMWWKSARTPASREPATEIVSCRIGGGLRFMAKDDCRAQGGRF